MRARNLIAAAAMMACATGAFAACCYFSALEKDVNQPGQKAFITWDPKEKRESFTVQPSFEGDARDFGMVVPTPTQPKLDEMPRDLFKFLAVYTILLPMPEQVRVEWEPIMYKSDAFAASAPRSAMEGGMPRARGVRVLESGVVGSLDYKIITAENANGLFEWLKENDYKYSGDKPTLDHYVQRKWIFTVMKIDAKQMKPGPGGTYKGEVTPTRFAFQSDSLVYPLKITQISVEKNTDALFYVMAPDQMDLEGSWSWAWSYRVMWLNSGTVCISQKQMTDAERQELSERQRRIEELRQEVPGFDTTKLEWAKRLDDYDMGVLEKPVENWPQLGMPDVPKDAKEVTLAEMKDELWAAHMKQAGSSGDNEYARGQLAELDQRYGSGKGKLVRVPPDKDSPEPRFFWFPNREAPEADVAALGKLKGLLQKGQFLCKFRKSFMKEEMKKDLDIVPAESAMRAEYYRILPQSPP